MIMIANRYQQSFETNNVKYNDFIENFYFPILMSKEYLLCYLFSSTLYPMKKIMSFSFAEALNQFR